MATAIPQVDSGDLVLEVLESDDPEVRDRLREGIDDELSTRREDRREERRERRKAQAEQMVRDRCLSISTAEASSVSAAGRNGT